VVISDVIEDDVDVTEPRQMVTILARRKAMAVVARPRCSRRLGPSAAKEAKTKPP